MIRDRVSDKLIVSKAEAHDELPANGEVLLRAFQHAGVLPDLLAKFNMGFLRHCAFRMQRNLASVGADYWRLESEEVDLLEGDFAYSTPPDTVMLLDAKVLAELQPSEGASFLLPVTKKEYRRIPDKLQRGIPRLLAFDFIQGPDLTIWPVPERQAGPLRLSYNCVVWRETPSNSVAVRWIEALSWAMAVEIRRFYPVPVDPPREYLEREAARAFRDATLRIV